MLHLVCRVGAISPQLWLCPSLHSLWTMLPPALKSTPLATASHALDVYSWLCRLPEAMPLVSIRPCVFWWDIVLLPYISCFSFPGQSTVLYLDPTTTSQTKLFLFPLGCSLRPCPLVVARLCPLNSTVAIPRPLGPYSLCSLVIMLPLTHHNHSTRPHLC